MKGSAAGSALFSNSDLVSLILPLIIEQILNITLGFFDVLMVASLGEGAVSAVSIGDSINILVIGVFGALATGGAVVCAHYFGSRSVQMISITAKQLIWTSLFISFVITTVGLVFQSQILNLIFGDVEQNVMRDAKIYFFYSLLSYPLVALYNSVAALFRAQGNSSVSMAASFLVNVLNIGGNAFCLYVLGWGVEGVAIPTLVSRGIAALFLLALLYRGRPYKNKPAIIISGLHRFKPDIKIIQKILAIGVPNSVENSVFQIGKILVLTLMAGFGTAAMAANAAANKLCELSCIPGIAMSFAMITVVGQTLGAGKKEEAVYLNRKLLVITYITLALTTMPFIIWARQVIDFFNLQNDTAILTRKMFLLHGICGMVIWPVSFVLPASLRAAGDARRTMAVSFLSMWIVRVGLSYVFALFFELGAMSIWYAMICDWIVRSVFFVTRWRRRFKPC
ncbi:MAG: MATE family efflux transporter [Termitinemataceae bacterium]|nr:MAG: MATE family efflux transporter [Termitinemataceae bacterium]